MQYLYTKLISIIFLLNIFLMYNIHSLILNIGVNVVGNVDINLINILYIYYSRYNLIIMLSFLIYIQTIHICAHILTHIYI